ncbi:hypothetical protein EMPS_05694 [Entomortierella parvispora]|uniref:F-box domain-containing protein n=1 Tax=Entomortierella parvispora TaxID=205924 RepID=A0A9P3HB45_9FUNG|nr:hypothetical protein EMPS_05694 [Entomortierella parvispora]
MQLQAERDHFVHAGIGGGSSSTSPSPTCSPSNDSPLSFLSITGLKKPRAKKTKTAPAKAASLAGPLTSPTSAAAHVSESTSLVAVEEEETAMAAQSPSMPVLDPLLPVALTTQEDVEMTSPDEESFPPLPEQQQPAVPALPAMPGDLAHVPPTTHHSEIARGSDILARLPLELLIDILRHLDALDLSRVAQASRQCLRILHDEALWRIKSREHPLFSGRMESASGLNGPQRSWSRPWFNLYKYLHYRSLSVKDNWSRAQPQTVHVLEGHTGLISSLEMSMWTLVTASIDSTIRVWDLRTLQCTQVLHSKQSLTCVAQSETARAACARTSFGGLCIWDLHTGELIMQDDDAMPHIASFLYMDETYIGYGQCDGMVTVFDWSSRTHLDIVGSYQAHEGDVIHISIMNHNHVISASTNGETLVYSLVSGCILERILLPHATQAIQFTPTIHGDKVMFSTRDAVYEYELMLDYISSGSSYTGQKAAPMTREAGHQHELEQDFAAAGSSSKMVDSQFSFTTSGSSSQNKNSPRLSRTSRLATSTRPTPPAGRVWKPSNSLLSQIRQRVGTGKVDNERLYIPTRFPRLASLCCLPRTSRTLDHGTTSARDSYGVFLPNNCTRLGEIAVYTRATKQIRQIHGPAVDRVLEGAIRNPFYTTMECNQHCAVVSSGSKIYVISFLPPEL